MKKQEKIDFERIAQAIEYLQAHFHDQPNLEKVAKKLHLSPFHFQRLFTKWAGVSPKKFLQYISVEHAKKLLQENQVSLFHAAYKTGLSGASRLHDLFVSIEGMTPGEYKNGGEHLLIKYSFAASPFGNILIASTVKGLCYLGYVEDKKQALQILKNDFPKATYKQMTDTLQQNALRIFKHDWSKLGHIPLHLKGTPFQLKVWEALLKIPSGKVVTYGTIATHIQKSKAYRAVGTAIGNNPVAFLIPCHRVIQGSGMFGNYHWGKVRKTAMLGWEGARTSKPK